MLHAGDRGMPDIVEKKFAPDIASLSERFRGCLNDADELPRDWTKLFHKKLFAMDMSFVTEATQLYHRFVLPQ